MLHELYTKQGENLTGEPWNVYPRPQMRRDSWMNLNGEWDFAVGEPVFDGKTILVPFCPESQLSGIHTHFPEGAALWYRRKLILPEGFNRGRVLLHIGAADQIADIYINGKHMTRHEGGYEAFSVDITDALQEENEISIRCYDDLNDQSYPYGKQVKPEKRGGMWYTPVSGIWQSVWLESVPREYIRKLSIENRGCAVTIDTGRNLPGTVTVAGLGTFALEQGRVTISPEDPHLWSPEDPYLYDFVVAQGEDRVESYFAIRSLEVKMVGEYPRLCLNGKPYFFHGLLDQGYWPEGLLTPPAPESYAEDILAMKALGFNTLRKHIKVEMEEFYYQCDRLGMIVWQDLVNNSDYNFLRDTALPTVGIQKLNDRKLHKDEKHREMFKICGAAAVSQLKNHPCICYWTIFNEAWGQFDSDNVYGWFKTLDDTRFIDTTSGWFRRNKSDVDSRHVYFKKIQLKGDGRKPLVLSEFGGKTYKAEGHLFNPDRSYGYGGCETLDALNEEVSSLYLDEIVPCIHKGLCASIYTQVSDVEDEINGLVTYDRKLVKLRPEVMLPVAEALRTATEKQVAKNQMTE
ncbi:MAG: glycoside hydrolase family 2 [Oscillospiraceae bacterium]|nr:glycoside hydrolase family 2 [Oscillospiraceae bacterium]